MSAVSDQTEDDKIFRTNAVKRLGRSSWLRNKRSIVHGMHYNWNQHQRLAQTIACTPKEDFGVGLALMGVALLMLIKDLETDLVNQLADRDAIV